MLFSVFGGLGVDVDGDKPIETLIEQLILEHYSEIYDALYDFTQGERLYEALLKGAALGDRRTHSAYKRAHTSEKVGAPILEFLIQSHLLILEPSREEPPHKEYDAQSLKKEIQKHIISDKLLFSYPFFRFWFAFVLPNFKEIQKGNYTRFFQQFQERSLGFSSLIFEKLSIELLKHHQETDPLVEVNSYWDRQIEIDVLARSKEGKTFVGECKFTNTKVNKSELTKLKEKCALANLEVDVYVLFSKRGFSNELLSLQSPMLLLFTLDDFQSLLENLSSEDLIASYLDLESP